MRGLMGRVMKNLSLLLGLLTLLAVTQESVARAGQAMQPLVAQPPLRADCTPAQVAFKICRAPEAVVGGKQPATTQAAGQNQKQPVVAFPAAPVAVAPAAPQEFVACQGVAPISINVRRGMANADQIVKSAIDGAISNIDNQDNHAFVNGRYQLCFSMLDIQPISAPIIFNKQLNNEVIISGLKLTKFGNFQEPLFDISSQQPVTIIDSTFTNVTNGIRLSGAAHTIERVMVSGDGAGSCAVVDGNGITFSQVDLSQCHFGVDILQNDFHLINNSKVYANHVGMHVWANVVGTDFRDSAIYTNSDQDPSTLDIIRFEDARRNYPVIYYQHNVRDDQFQLLEEGLLGAAAFDEQLRPYLAPQLEDGTQHFEVELYSTDQQACGLQSSSGGQPCKLISAEPIGVSQQAIQETPLEIIIGEQFRSKGVTAVLRDQDGVYAPIKEINLGGGGIVALGGVNPIIVPAPVASADGVQDGAQVDPLAGPAAEGDGEEEVQVAFGGPNGADVGGPDVGHGENLGGAGGGGGGSGGPANDEIISAKDGAAESNSGHSGDKVAFGGDSDAVQVADGGFVTSGASGTSGGCSLNTQNSGSSLTWIFFAATFLLAKTRRKLQKM